VKELTTSPWDAICRLRSTAPHSVAVISHRSGVGRKEATWSAFASAVERYAASLRCLGVRPGEVVVLSLPNWWRTSALIVACWRVGAIAALHDVAAATVQFTVDPAAPRPPGLRHRVLLRGRSDQAGDWSPTGDDVDFAERFERAPRAERRTLPRLAADPDRPAVLLTGPSSRAYTFRDLHKDLPVLSGGAEIRAEDVLFSTYDLAQPVGLAFGLLLPVTTGATGVLLDTFTLRAAHTVMVSEQVTVLAGGSEILARISPLVALRTVVTHPPARS
jgi:hypothetical protein